MDRLSDLPEGKSSITDKENQILTQYFGESQPLPKQKSGFKLVLYTTILFALLANPWIDNLFCKLPYCGTSDTTVFVTKIALFVLLFSIIYMFLI